MNILLRLLALIVTGFGLATFTYLSGIKYQSFWANVGAALGLLAAIWCFMKATQWQ